MQRDSHPYGLEEKACFPWTCVQKKHAWFFFHSICEQSSCDRRLYGRYSYGQCSCGQPSCVESSFERDLSVLSTCVPAISGWPFFHPSSHHVMIFWLP